MVNTWDVELHEEGFATWKCRPRRYGNTSIAVIIPADVVAALGLVPGDEIEVAVRKVVE